MNRLTPYLITAGLALTGTACSDTQAPQTSAELSAAFASLPYGFELAPNTFAGTSIGGPEWAPESSRFDREDSRGRDGDDRGGHRGPGNGFMCGGLGHGFLAGFFGFGVGFGRGFFSGAHLDGHCEFNAASGRVECDTVSRHGLSIVRSAQYRDEADVVQEAFDDSTTNSINLRVDVSGTVRRRRGDTASVEHSSDRTVTGLADGSTERTVNGTSAGTELLRGLKRDSIPFTAERILGDTIDNVVVPVRTDSTKTFPTSGRVIRSASVTVNIAGEDPRISTRREVLTYNGTNQATLEITENGVTKNCTLKLPHGRPVCS